VGGASLPPFCLHRLHRHNATVIEGFLCLRRQLVCLVSLFEVAVDDTRRACSGYPSEEWIAWSGRMGKGCRYRWDSYSSESLEDGPDHSQERERKKECITTERSLLGPWRALGKTDRKMAAFNCAPFCSSISISSSSTHDSPQPRRPWVISLVLFIGVILCALSFTWSVNPFSSSSSLPW